MRINVLVHPNSKKPRVEKDILGQLNVYVSAPPIEGRANKAVIEALAQHFKTKKDSISLVSGQKSKLKLFEIGTE
jgi:hypothetical protein